ncbi:2-dehydropantoate 2-reductase [Priestia koreensis]|uniref:2-dehydropantoate 2-reductase n=1 Tax=Priestia koreensis TaxID=284581 RepID=UPI001F564F1B|nr:2-dehydropantoate 2-reductase [Priestia koreensis]UNL83976.1 2-dehydropantoate 2-reductase [Priestia koreensis]
MNRIAIIGGGSVGLLYAARLASYHEVTVYTKSNEQARAINEKGIQLEEGEQINVIRVKAAVISDGIAPCNLAVIAVKQYHLSSILPFLREIPPTTPLLFLQNGMSHLEIIDSLPHTYVFLGLVEHGALKTGDVHVKHTGIGTTRLCMYKENHFIHRELLKNSTDCFSFVEEHDWYKTMIKKLIVNAVINPLTALYRVENGMLPSVAPFRQNMEQLFAEVVLSLGINEGKEYWESILTVCEQTAFNRSSMLRDIESKRQTEVDSILGYIISEGERRRVDVPLATFLYNSIKGLEKKQKK